MPRIPLRVAALAIVLAWAPPREAGAICGRVPVFEVLPGPGATVPRSSHVFVRAAGDTASWCDVDVPGAVCARARFELELRSAPGRDRPRRKIETRTKKLETGTTTLLELTPSSLPADSGVEVWLVDRSGLVSERVIGAFRTDAREDKEPPREAAIKDLIVRRVQKGVIVLEEECGTDRVMIELEAFPEDDSTPNRQLFAALWFAGPNDTIDYDAPPTTMRRIEVDTEALRRGPLIFSGNSYDDDIPKVSTTKPIKVGLRLLDLSGNRSAPAEKVSK